MTGPSIKLGIPRSLRARLLVFLLGAIMLSAAVEAVLAYVGALHQADAVFDRHMQKMAEALRSGTALEAPAGEVEVNPDRADEDFVVQMWTAAGQPMFESAAHRALRSPPAPGFSLVRAADGRDYRIFSLHGSRRVIMVAQDMADRRGMAESLAGRGIVPTLLMAPVLMLAVWWVVSRSLAPVEGLRAQMAVRKADEFAPLSDKGLPAEIGPLIHELNLLTERRSRAFESQKAFVADAAHEMRSPLAALKIQLQGLQRAGDEPGRERAVRRLAAGIERATHLVDQLLVLARQEASAASGVAPEALDLAQIGFLSLSDTVAAAQARRIDLGVHRADAAPVRGHAEAIRILVRNLLDNAVKYTPEGGSVDLDVRATAEGALLTVEDSGPGIPEGDRARVLDRFYRVAGSGATGSGLGLAIVKAVADAHGADVRLDASGRLGGLRVRVAFPRPVPI